MPYSLVVQLARDLQNAFYPHFKEFFTVITSLLKIHDATVIEVSTTLYKLIIISHYNTAILYYTGLPV